MGFIKIRRPSKCTWESNGTAHDDGAPPGLLSLKGMVASPAIKSPVNTIFPAKVGVTVTVATTGAVPGLVAVNEAILPVPLAAKPMAGVLFTQLKVVPAVGLVNVLPGCVAPLQTVSLGIGLTEVHPTIKLKVTVLSVLVEASFGSLKPYL